jgi:hypothetical protein
VSACCANSMEELGGEGGREGEREGRGTIIHVKSKNHQDQQSDSCPRIASAGVGRRDG